MTILAKRNFPANWDNLLADMFENEERSDAPAANIVETNDDFRVEIAAPGMDKKDFNIALEDNMLTISSEKKKDEKKKENYLHREFCHTHFKRTFSLPETVNTDKIKAHLENGVLSVNIPKKQEAVEKAPRKIEIA